MSASPKILIVDDDADIRELLAEYLHKYGFTVFMAEDGKTMFKVLAETTPDIIVLDIMLPGEDGLVLCKRLRETSSLPVIFLTALDSGTDRVVGLELGADDYVVKPFDPRELLARIRTVLRRTNNDLPKNSALITKPSSSAKLCFSGWALTPLSRELIDPDGTSSNPTDVLFKLLMVFLEHPFEVLSRDSLLTLTQGRTADAFDRSIDIQVSRLRNLLKDNGHEPGLIKTIRGGGYMLAVDVNEEN